MGWIEPSDKMPPEGLEVLLEVSGYCKSNIAMLADHSYYLGSWIHPTGDEEGHWLIDSEHPPINPTVHAWMPLPKHFQPQEHFTQEDDLMEHAMFEDKPEWLYKGDAVYGQMTLEEFLNGDTRANDVF